jgi:beta-hydroxylase
MSGAGESPQPASLLHELVGADALRDLTPAEQGLLEGSVLGSLFGRPDLLDALRPKAEAALGSLPPPLAPDRDPANPWLGAGELEPPRGGPAFYDVSALPVARELVARLDDIVADLEAAGRQDELHDAPYPLPIYSGDWRIMTLRSNEMELSYEPVAQQREFVASMLGEEHAAGLDDAAVVAEHRAMVEEVTAHNRAICPTVTGILDPLYPESCVMYSFNRMAPGVRLAPHHGQRAGNLRVHLCVQEASGCWLEVCGERREWHRGEVFGFDDSQLHRAEHHGTEERVVLVVDFRWSYVRGELERTGGAGA